LERQRTIFAMTVAASILTAMPGTSQAALIAHLPAGVSDDNVTKAWSGDCWRDSGALLPPVTVLTELRHKGLVRRIGLSSVTPGADRRTTDLRDRADDAPIDDLARDGIPYVPYFPLGGFNPLQSSILYNPRSLRASMPRRCRSRSPGYFVAREPHLSRAQLAGRRGHDTERDWQHGSRSECDTPAGQLKSLERFVSSAAMPHSHRPWCLRSRGGRLTVGRMRENGRRSTTVKRRKRRR
jgi:hypothetical protein